MAYFNNSNNAGLYPTSSASGEFDTYLFPGQTTINDEANAFADNRSTGGQPSYTAGPSRSLRPGAGFGECSCSLLDERYLTREYPDPTSSGTLYTPQTYGYGQPSLPGYDRSTIDPYTQSHYSGIVSQEGSFASVMAPRFSTVVPTPSSG